MDNFNIPRFQPITIALLCMVSHIPYSVLGKCPWALKLTILAHLPGIKIPCSYRSCYIDPLKLGTWALTHGQEWALARDT